MFRTIFFNFDSKEGVAGKKNACFSAFPTAALIIGVPIRIHSVIRHAVTRKTNTGIIEIAESPSIRT